MDLLRDGPTWPHHAHSRLVEAAGLRWHVQAWPAADGSRPEVLLLHGTGASTHSWRDIAPRLAGHVGVWAVDLPGHAFSGPASDGLGSLPGMAVRRFAIADIASGKPVIPELLLEATAPLYVIDNMEAIALCERQGETRVTLMSDDNFNSPVQSTILLQFAYRR